MRGQPLFRMARAIPRSRCGWLPAAAKCARCLNARRDAAERGLCQAGCHAGAANARVRGMRATPPHLLEKTIMTAAMVT